MKLVRWTRFTWNLSDLPASAPLMPDRYSLRQAHPDDAAEIKRVIFHAFSLDSAWGDSFAMVKDWLEMNIDLMFERESTPAVIVQHGQRIIGASALATDVDAETHLISGPCMLMEYQNRGFGSRLLYYTLKQLQDAGLERVHGVAKENVAVARFIYPKFGSTGAPHVFEPGLART